MHPDLSRLVGLSLLLRQKTVRVRPKKFNKDLESPVKITFRGFFYFKPVISGTG